LPLLAIAPSKGIKDKFYAQATGKANVKFCSSSQAREAKQV